VYSEADKAAPYLRLADRAICIGPGPAKESYLNIPRIIAAAEVADVDAIHPGYGFLSERPGVCADLPRLQDRVHRPLPRGHGQARRQGRLQANRQGQRRADLPGLEGAIDDEEEACKIAEKIGYPVIIKAAAGGGGRGMRSATTRPRSEQASSRPLAEAQAAFGNGAVFIEKFLEHARHVEVQCLGDKHGNAVHLFERDCSMQRRHQKIIEEAPGPGIDRASVTRSASPQPS
jgi:acetyl-CoA carboxylase biotin carboxylase subunit